jgi:hypothetical protein
VDKEQWLQLIGQLEKVNTDLSMEVQTVWQDLRAMVDGLQSRAGGRSTLSSAQLELPDYQEERNAAASDLLEDPLHRLETWRPLTRVRTAFETQRWRIDQLLLGIPERGPVTGLAEVAVDDPESSIGVRLLAKWRRAERPVSLRALAAGALHRAIIRGLFHEGRILAAFAQAALQAAQGWETCRHNLDSKAAGQPVSDRIRISQQASLDALVAELEGRQARALEDWKQNAGCMKRRLIRRVLGRMRTVPASEESPSDRLRRFRDHWDRLGHAVDSSLQLERALTEFEKGVIDHTRAMVAGLAAERLDLLGEVDQVIHWLEEQSAAPSGEVLPLPVMRVVPFDRRRAEFDAAFQLFLARLPADCHCPRNFPPLPRRGRPKRRFPVRDIMRREYRFSLSTHFADTLAEIQAEHQKFVREIERVNEVVSFGREESLSGETLRPELQLEAFQNTLSLLRYDRSQARDWQPSVSARLVRLLGSYFQDCRLDLSRRWLGILSFLFRTGFRRGSARIFRGVRFASSQAGRAAVQMARSAWLRGQIAIGWRREPLTGQVEVISRPVLPREFTADLASKHLPTLYRHLFRFEPVQDPRFLVGRTLELDAIREARDFWLGGRPAAVIIVGVRGSGKTSLINCALKSLFSELEVIRGELDRRVVTAVDFRQVLADIIRTNAGNRDISLKSEEPGGLEEYLAQKRRVFVLEEVERAFLRQVGHLAAIRELQRLIAATTSTTLWILGINRTAFQFLQAAVSLGTVFSHRIDAGTARNEDLREAILQRHNLSGLRLQYALPASHKGLTGRLKQLLHGRTDVAKLFLDTLSLESAGVYRSAFNIWLSHIEGVHEGVLHLNSLEAADLAPVIEDLAERDIFTLVAILQHGGLTPEEHSRVFQTGLSASRAQMDELLAREIIEPDPGRSGLRIRPEAMRVVREVLERRNLL